MAEVRNLLFLGTVTGTQAKPLTLCRWAGLLIKYPLVTERFKRIERSTP